MIENALKLAPVALFLGTVIYILFFRKDRFDAYAEKMERLNRKLFVKEECSNCIDAICDECDRDNPNNKEEPDAELWDADPNVTYAAPGGGVKCRKCPGWFCY